MSNVRLIWITPDAEKTIAYCARVSNPKNQDNPNVEKLLRYCIRHGHWSVFEMANVCFEIETTRDIARQILRHRSFQFQELSYRYSSLDVLERELTFREARLQDTANRQNSLEADDEELKEWWLDAQKDVAAIALETYKQALNAGIAKEVARTVLPEGMTPSRMYVNGTVRSWLHYADLRTRPETQKEHREVANQVKQLIWDNLPTIGNAMWGEVNS